MSDLSFLLESFQRIGRVNQRLLQALTPAEADLSDGRGGWTVEQHLRHMAGFRVGWLWNLSPEHADPLLDHSHKDADGDPMWRWQHCPVSELHEAFSAGDGAAVKAVQAHLASGEPFADP